MLQLRLIPPLALLISIFFSNPVDANSANVASIIIKGNKTVSSTKITLMLRTKVGGVFDEQLWKKDIQGLISTGYFSSVRYEIKELEKGLEITLILEEYPQIEGIRFTGAKSIKKTELEKAAEIKKGDYCSETLVNSAIEKLKKLYQDKNIYYTDITATTIPGTQDKVILTFDIDEGKKKLYVEKISFSGNNAFDSNLLRSKMKIKQRNMPFIRGIFKPDILESDIERIKNFYNDNGYPECRIEKDVSVKGLWVNVVIRIDEGEKYYFGKTEFHGDLIFTSEKLRKTIEYREKDVYSQKKMDKTLSNILKLYSDVGYINPEIIPVPEIKDSKINYLIIINPRQQVRINEINITGNTITKDKVIRRELVIHPGDIFSGTKVRKSFNNIADLQYFEEIDITPEPTEDERFVNLNVSVKERERTGLFTFGAGYSSIEKTVGFISIEQRNFDISNPPYFRGSGQNMRFEATLGGITKNLILSFTEPYLFDRPILFGTDIWITERSWDSYSEKHNGFGLRFGRRWENFSLGFKLMTDDVKLSEIKIPEFQNQTGSNRINSLTTSFTFQNLDRRIMPKSGDLAELSVEYAGGLLGSDIEYWKASFTNDYYKSFGRWVFHSKTYAGTVDSFGSTKDVPLYERFFGGGIGTVRGFKERELGPTSVDKKYFLGGKSIFAQNLELMYPLSGENEILWGVLFFDAGNVWAESFDFSDLKQSVGLGLRIKVPVMPVPIQIDYGWAINPEPWQEKGRLHIGFTLGF
ncbi:MAG: outer membrane protein assembly factor BamA [Candidatus Omnitrophica bacterium]|nr:outer membrane protein assembly factor BamA [Candidatus Omnitrophota bacterium]